MINYLLLSCGVIGMMRVFQLILLALGKLTPDHAFVVGPDLLDWAEMLVVAMALVFLAIRGVIICSHYKISLKVTR